MAQVHPTTPGTRPIIASIDIADRVRDLTARVLGIAPDRVVEAADFVRDLGASSLDLVELIMAVEDAFGIEISDSAAERITTVSDLQAFIRRQGPAGPAPPPPLSKLFIKFKPTDRVFKFFLIYAQIKKDFRESFIGKSCFQKHMVDRSVRKPRRCAIKIGFE